MACVVILRIRSMVDHRIDLGLRVTLLMSLRLRWRLRIRFHGWPRRAGTCVCRCPQLRMITNNVVFMRDGWDWWFGALCSGRNNGLLLLNWHAGSFTVFHSFGQRIVVVALIHSYLLDHIFAIACIQSHHQLRDEVCMLGSISYGRRAWTSSLAFARTGRRVAVGRGMV
jgi:hypothetical protein